MDINNKHLIKNLKSVAVRAASFSHSPYSHFRVGAAVLTSDGDIFTGANIENASFGLTICAERSAIFNAMSNTRSEVIMIAIYTKTSQPTAPCGACRQVLLELAPNAEIITICDTDIIRQHKVTDLLPDSFNHCSLSHSEFQNTSQTSLGRICIDIDNVIAETDSVIRALISETTQGRVNLEYKDITTFNYWECVDSQGNSISKSEWKVVHNQFSKPKIIHSIKPYVGVQDILKRIQESYIIHFATARLPAARAATINWLENHDFPSHDIHFLKHGEKHLSLGIFDLSVEDDPDQARAFAESGVGLNFILSHPWNAHITKTNNLSPVNDWADIEKHLCE